MDELASLLLFHFRRYPQMDCADAVKLLYQNEFGCGHMIKDVEQSFLLLSSEAAAVKAAATAAEAMAAAAVEKREVWLTEPIGGGLCRVYLDHLPERFMKPLHEAFLQTAAETMGSLNRFLDKLALLTELTRQGSAPFSKETLRKALAEYRQMGYPALSHSERYRQAYQPHYRVVRRALLPFSDEVLTAPGISC